MTSIILKKYTGKCGIVYCLSRKDCDTTASKLLQVGEILVRNFDTCDETCSVCLQTTYVVLSGGHLGYQLPRRDEPSRSRRGSKYVDQWGKRCSTFI